MALKQIKNKIISTKKTGKVTKAMESVSAVKMRKSQLRALESRPYVLSAVRMLGRVAALDEIAGHPLAIQRGAGKTLLIIVTSDKGLAGSVNSAVLRKVDSLIQQESVDVIALGRKAVEYAERNRLGIVGRYTNVRDDVTLSDVYDIARQALAAYTETATYRTVRIIYQNFISTFEQQPTERQILPLDAKAIEDMAAGIRPKSGVYSAAPVEEGQTVAQYLIEPNAQSVLEALIPQLVEIVVFHALMESKASEHSARRVAMKNATDKSNEVAADLTRLYNKARQAAITAEVSEITAGVEAMK